jgi:hypothetical protein
MEREWAEHKHPTLLNPTTGQTNEGLPRTHSHKGSETYQTHVG